MTLRMAAGDPEGSGVVCLFKRKKALSLGTGPWAARVFVACEDACCGLSPSTHPDYVFFWGGGGECDLLGCVKDGWWSLA